MLFSLGSVCVFTADSINALADKHSQLCCVKDSSVTPWGKDYLTEEYETITNLEFETKI